MLRDRYGDVPVHVRHGGTPLQPRKTFFVVRYARGRPLRFIKIEIAVQRIACGKELRRIRLVARTAVGGGNADDDGAAVPFEAEPKVVVLICDVEGVINIADGRSARGVGIEPDLRHIPPLQPVCIQRLQNESNNVVISDGVGIVEQDIVDARHCEKFDVPRDHPRVAQRIIAVERFAHKMELVRGTCARRIVGIVQRRIRPQLFELVYVVYARHALRTEPGEIEQTDVAPALIRRVNDRDRAAVIVDGGQICHAVFLCGKTARIEIELRFPAVRRGMGACPEYEQRSERERHCAECLPEFSFLHKKCFLGINLSARPWRPLRSAASGR